MIKRLKTFAHNLAFTRLRRDSNSHIRKCMQGKMRYFTSIYAWLKIIKNKTVKPTK